MDHPLQSFGQIYFSKSWMTLDDHKVHQKQKLFRGGFVLDCVWLRWEWLGTPEVPKILVSKKSLGIGLDEIFWSRHSVAGTPSKKCFLQSLKALCLSSKMMYQHILYLLSLWTY